MTLPTVWHDTIPEEIFSKLKDACIERRKDNEWDYNDKLVGALNSSSLEPTEGLENYLINIKRN